MKKYFEIFVLLLYNIINIFIFIKNIILSKYKLFKKENKNFYQVNHFILLKTCSKFLKSNLKILNSFLNS